MPTCAPNSGRWFSPLATLFIWGCRSSRRQPFGCVALSAGGFGGAHVARRRRPAIFAHGVEGGPARIAGDAALVAHPSHLVTHVAEDHRITLHAADHFPGARPIVVSVLIDGALGSRPAVETVAAVGAIDR